jgi:hypothetical protein
MRRPMRVFSGFAITVFVLTVSAMAQGMPGAEQKSIAIVFNDGHRQNIPLNEIDRIEFKSGPVVVFRDGHQQNLGTRDIARIEFSSQIKDLPFGRNHFVGKWEVGVGAFGAGHFFITLEPSGEARKTLGSSHGKWTLVDGEARITWDDGWHDAIRKVGSTYEKRAFAPGKTFSEDPSNVTDAKNTTAEPI